MLPAGQDQDQDQDHAGVCSQACCRRAEFKSTRRSEPVWVCMHDHFINFANPTATVYSVDKRKTPRYAKWCLLAAAIIHTVVCLSREVR
jgi:hypothetical protein